MVRCVPYAIVLGWWCALAAVASAQLPAGFVDLPVGGNWNQAVGVGFAPPGAGPAGGRMFVWEKAGRVWIVDNGVKQATPLIDISDEVGDWRDFGLVGFVADPGYWTNGRIYLLYVVDYHHVIYAGTPQYNPATNTYFHDTIGRITRYTASAASNFTQVDYASRAVLVGESITTGFPICHQSHGVGALVFGEDGTLMASCGDGASYETTDTGGPINGSSNTALADGIIKPKENVGAFRSQLVDSLSGKIIRIDPGTGDAVPSNPFYDAAQPRSARSRVWALGLRNPYRMCLRPGTGNPDPAAADPGTIYLGDVGWATWEDLHTITGPGQNCGWPLFEGLTGNSNYQGATTLNQDAPNPLSGGSCAAYFRFKDLCIQDTLAPSWPNPCDASQQVPATLPRFVHRRPALDWRHGQNLARTGIYSGNNAAEINVGASGSPVSGSVFPGNCSTGGAWYTGTSYPAQYRNTYFQGEFGSGWIKSFVFDGADRPTQVISFAPDGTGSIVGFAAHPNTGDIFYIRYSDTGVSTVRQIAYPGGGSNLPPVASASASPAWGNAPLSVQFSSAGTYDPEGLPVTFDWDFGDGVHSSQANPTHVYLNEVDLTAQGAFHAKVFTLNPPNPVGSGNPDPEVMRDGDYPPSSTQDPLRQWDDFHNGDQGTSDWVGYIFPQNVQISAVVFQEGLHFSNGGWWDSLRIQTYNGSSWADASGVTFTPGYAGNNGVPFETYIARFPAVSVRGVRLRGNPGGNDDFVSVGELRVLGPDPSPSPRCITARLTVYDYQGLWATRDVQISLNNSPPQVAISSPVNGALYSMRFDTTAPLTADITDAEHSAGQISCVWNVILHHGGHTHPEPPDPACATSALLTPHSEDCGDFHYEFRLTATDAACLSTTQTVYMYPNCCRPDYNNDGFLDGIDADAFNNDFEDGNGAADYNADGFIDGIDYDTFMNDFEAGCP